MNEMLKTIIKKQSSPGDYFILCANDRNQKKGWREVPYKYKNPKMLDKQIKSFLQDFPESKYDLYFCPVTYPSPKRRKAEVNDIKYLWQDIDEKDDIESLNPQPTYLWESSPNKFQGLWELDRYITGEQADELNRALADLIGADSCSDIGHVIRIPGTINHKYKDKPRVGKVINSKKIYRYPKIKKEWIKTPKRNKSSNSSNSSSKGTLRASKIISKYNISGKLLDTLTAPEAEQGRRSDTIWYLENKLFEKGLEIPEILCLIKASVWNKYKGRPDEDERLRKEAEKILEKDINSEGNLTRLRENNKKEFKVNNYLNIMSNLNTFPGWMVEGFWGRRSHGIVAGQPKVFKSTYTHDFAVSVASGEPFLGKFKVCESGPVLIVQNENTEYMVKDRTEKIICNRRGLVGSAVIKSKKKVHIKWPKDIPLYTIDQQGFQLDNPEHQAELEKVIEQIKPIHIIFDPLYLMFSGNMNAADELNPVLNWLLEIKNKYKCGIMLVHHYNKGTDANRGGQKMLGSVVLHGWTGSAWYIRRKPEPNTDLNVDLNQQMLKPTSVILEREFREAGEFPEIELKISMGEVGDTRYEVETEVYVEEANGKAADDGLKEELIKDYLLQILKASSFPLNKKELIKKFEESYPDQRISQRKIKDIVDGMLSNKDVSFIPGKGFYIKS